MHPCILHPRREALLNEPKNLVHRSNRPDCDWSRVSDPFAVSGFSYRRAAQPLLALLVDRMGRSPTLRNLFPVLNGSSVATKWHFGSRLVCRRDRLPRRVFCFPNPSGKPHDPLGRLRTRDAGFWPGTRVLGQPSPAEGGAE